jgi:dihydrofolate reductase
VAVAEHGVIGSDGEVPWDLPAEFAHYQSTVAGHPAVVGRRTFDNMDPLPESLNLVLTSDGDRSSDAENVRYVTGKEEAVRAAADAGAETVYVIGGEGVYEAFLPHVKRIVMSRIHGEYEGDRHFPELGPEWEEVSSEEHEGFTVVELVQSDPDPL